MSDNTGSLDKSQYYVCPLTCPNRVSSHQNKLGKGYTFLFCIAITFLLIQQSIGVKYSSREGLELNSRDIPLMLLVPCLFLIAGAVGINTDKLAEKIGGFLDKSPKVL